jgi:hypothetical protein
LPPVGFELLMVDTNTRHGSEAIVGGERCQTAFAQTVACGRAGDRDTGGALANKGLN